MVWNWTVESKRMTDSGCCHTKTETVKHIHNALDMMQTLHSANKCCRIPDLRIKIDVVREA